MEQSILKTVKKAVNIDPNDPAFDIDIINAINAEFSTVTDLGVGPEIGFVIEDDSLEWTDFLDTEEDPEKRILLSKVKMAVILKTRLLFDPPAQSFLIASLEKQLLELEWRLNVNREAKEYTDPLPDEVAVIDGGDPSSD